MAAGSVARSTIEPSKLNHRVLEVRVRVVLGAVVAIAGMRLFRRQVLEPLLEVLVKGALIVADEHARGDVHHIAREQALRDAGLRQGLLNRGQWWLRKRADGVALRLVFRPETPFPYCRRYCLAREYT